jgi:hypothetical protein
MNKFASILMAFGVFASSSIAQITPQTPVFAEWQSKPAMHATPPQYVHENAIMILQAERHEFVLENNEWMHYRTRHYIYKAGEQKSAATINEVGYSLYTLTDSLKGCIIKPNGTVIHLQASQYTYTVAQNGMRTAHLALKDLDKNAEVELLIKDVTYEGFFNSVTMQQHMPVLHTTFQMSYPKQLSFSVKGYHGMPTTTEYLKNNKKFIYVYKADIAPLDAEENSYYDRYCAKIDYRINYETNTLGIKTKDYSWHKLAAKLYEDNYQITKHEKQLIAGFLTQIGLRGKETEAIKIKRIEEGIKSGITLSNNNKAAGNNVDSIFAMHTASKAGYVRLFALCLLQAGVQHEMGITSDRTTHPVDEDFAQWGIMEHPIIYFPRQKRYLAPLQPYYRYPIVPYFMLHNKGVFCRTNPEAGYIFGREAKEGEGIVRTIATLSTNMTQSQAYIDVELNKEVPEAQAYYKITGYQSAATRAVLATATPAARKQTLDQMIRVGASNERQITYDVQNDAIKAVSAHLPLYIKAQVKLPEIMETTAEHKLLKIGELLGQSTFYKENHNRVLPVDMPYPHINSYKISMVIPKGYKAMNLEDLNSYQEQIEYNEGNPVAYFKATYQVIGNTLRLHITQAYPQMHYGMADFEAYRRVANAAATYAKKVLVFVPEKRVKQYKKAHANKSIQKK